jgi:dTDP-4-amino-4,6-dideoxygalactose transaminase
LPVAEQSTQSVLSLPVYAEMTEEQQEAVITAVQSFYG